MDVLILFGLYILFALLIFGSSVLEHRIHPEVLQNQHDIHTALVNDGRAPGKKLEL